MKRFNKIRIIKVSFIKDNLYQISALIEKNIKLKLRFKFPIIINFVTPIIGIIMPLIVLGQLFQFSERYSFGPWTAENFLVFQFIAYNIMLLRTVIMEFSGQFRIEKFWKTLPALMIAPFNRFNLLLGIFFSHLIMISIPFSIFFIVCVIYYPISILTGLFVVLNYFLIALIFSGIGLIIGVFAVSNENIWKALSFATTLIFWASCLSYPFEIYPSIIQQVINLNPLYYVFDFLRLTWIQNNFFLTLNLYGTHFIVLIITAIILPIFGVYTFNYILKKYGIVGY